MNPERYHLTLSRDGRPAMHGWWGRETVARDRFRDWVGDWGRSGARITLVDEDTGTVLTAWPDEP
ncbi:hypothetical protein MQE23_08545 [Streptomyces sp. HP-A2021]|uniref:hypothetical protein n=1 Tax=Streptomyces sp. HP-A2021 TaxID=2927875 RepID=UPI001FAE9CAD|nr:hypothetical protein [Streptomyces sp. HP-A2021]UOB09100.1 hypothetical protein MQE23_08545 [Streptomyces sp. HP-A2021]